MTNYIRAFLVLFFFGLLTACGGGGGGNTAASPMTDMNVTMTTGMPIMPPPMTTAQPVTLEVDSQEIGAMHFLDGGLRSWIVVFSAAAAVERTVIFGEGFNIERLMVSRVFARQISLPQLDRAHFRANGDLRPLVENNMSVTLAAGSVVVAFETNPAITALAQFCSVSWLSTYIDSQSALPNCPAAAGLSYTPNMPNVLHAAMADTFHRGIGIGESRLAFSGRHNGNDRAAGFTYDMGGYALRTDYVHLPSKQDSGVWLDTYRFGIMPYINDETRFFAGVDSYRNAILALDINAKNQHRFGIALGEGYAVQYELRVRL